MNDRPPVPRRRAPLASLHAKAVVLVVAIVCLALAVVAVPTVVRVQQDLVAERQRAATLLANGLAQAVGDETGRESLEQMVGAFAIDEAVVFALIELPDDQRVAFMRDPDAHTAWQAGTYAEGFVADAPRLGDAGGRVVVALRRDPR
ncbi:MAG: hypothetical protein AAGE94_17300, partial [Acidobacteriota bacterium]